MAESVRREVVAPQGEFDLRANAYLGDGLYARFDGFHVWLTCERDGRRLGLFERVLKR